LSPPTGERLGPHALCIVADGARSQLRDDTVIPKRIRPYPWGATVVRRRRPRRRRGSSLVQVVDGTRHMVGALPTGLGPGDGHTRKVSFFYSLRADRVDAWKARGLDAPGRELRRVSAAVRAPDRRHRLPRRHPLHPLPGRLHVAAWHTGRVVYLGDAAHAMSPQLGQGANLALWDALVLAECVAAEPSVDLALSRYSDARRAHLRFYQAANRWATLWFQSDHDALGALRDAFMPLAMKVPPLYRAMVTTLAGINTGVGLGATEPLR
jgi:2-polyprenyl-6-methoxyphenol hydroxylase-like FAD-dependent oxidoreductase